MEKIPYVFVEQEKLKALDEKLNRILEIIEKNNSVKPQQIGEWITEATAREMVGKGKSWFNYMRRKGHFTESKIGGTVYILKEDILRYLEKNKKKAFRK